MRRWASCDRENHRHIHRLTVVPEIDQTKNPNFIQLSFSGLRQRNNVLEPLWDHTWEVFFFCGHH